MDESKRPDAAVPISVTAAYPAPALARGAPSPAAAQSAPAKREFGNDWLAHIRGCAAGDHSALASLYDESSSLVYGIALRVLNNTADAEEITLDVFAQVWRSAASFDGQRGSVQSWLVTLVRSRSIDRLRSRHSRVKREEAACAETELCAAGAGPEEQTAHSQKHKRIQAALGTLSGEQRQAIELAFFSGLTHMEVATQLGEPLGTIKTRIRLGMMRLRDVLGDFA